MQTATSAGPLEAEMLERGRVCSHATSTLRGALMLNVAGVVAESVPADAAAVCAATTTSMPIGTVGEGTTGRIGAAIERKFRTHINEFNGGFETILTYVSS